MKDYYHLLIIIVAILVFTFVRRTTLQSKKDPVDKFTNRCLLKLKT